MTDDQGVAVTCPATSLDVGEQMVCTGAAEAATIGQYTNIGAVDATPAQPGPTSPTGEPGAFVAIIDPATGGPVTPVIADDPANHFGTGPGIEIQKQVCTLDDVAGCDVADDSVWSESTVIANGDDVTWRITVANIGNISLGNVSVVDTVAPSCDRTTELLDIGDVWIYTCTESGDTEPALNTATVEATPTAGNFPPVTSSDTAETLPPAELEVVKSTDATDFFVGETATYEIEVSNSGALDALDVELVDSLPTDLTNITLNSQADAVYDSATHTITWTIASLAIGETQAISYTAEVAATGSLVNEVAITSDHEENDLENNISSTSITATEEPTPPRLAFTGRTSRTLVSWSLLLLAAGVFFVLFGRRRNRSLL